MTFFQPCRPFSPKNTRIIHMKINHKNRLHTLANLKLLRIFGGVKT